MGINLFHLTILNLARFLIEVNDSENDFQTIDVIDAWGNLTNKFLYDSAKKMVKVLESLGRKHNMEGVGAKNLSLTASLVIRVWTLKIVINHV